MKIKKKKNMNTKPFTLHWTYSKKKNLKLNYKKEK